MSKFIKYSLLVLPLIFILGGLNMHKAKYANDPEYIYLVNATAICDGKFVGHIDNPGTTVMQIGAVTIAIKHLLNNPENEPLVQHVFKEPDQFVNAIRNVFLILNTLILLFLGWVAFKKTKSVWVALLLQISVFVTANTLDHVWTKMSPEPLLFFVSCLFVIAILYFYAEKEKGGWKYVFVFALLVGAGLGTKATFLPLAIFPFVVLPTFKKKFAYAFAVIPSFVVFTIPAIPEYSNMYHWFKKLISHSGQYGHGDEGMIDVATYFPNILKILLNNPFFALVLVIGTGFVSWGLIELFRNKTKLSRDMRILAGLVASLGFGLLLVAKHYHFNHYLIPVLILSGISLFFILNILFRFKIPFVNEKVVFPAVVILLVLIVGWIQPGKMKYASDGYKLTNKEMAESNIVLERDYGDYARIYFYPFSFYRESALNFGDVYTKRQMLPYLKDLYPSTYFYDFYWDKMQYWNADVSLEDVIEFNGNKVLMVGSPPNKKMLDELEKRGIPLKKIYHGRIQAYYEVDIERYKGSVKEKRIVEQILCDMENISVDNQSFVGSNGQSFGNAIVRSNTQYRSGTYAVVLDNKNEFALDYRLDSLKVGDLYEVEVWRKAENHSGRLVVASLDGKKFYQSQNDFISSDKMGWNLIRIRFSVNPEMENETLKIYLWNPKKQLAYFDDLTIKRIEYTNKDSNLN